MNIQEHFEIELGNDAELIEVIGYDGTLEGAIRKASKVAREMLGTASRWNGSVIRSVDLRRSRSRVIRTWKL